MKLALIVTSLIGLFFISCTPKNSFQGYQTVKTDRVDSIGSEVVQMVHKKSGASIVLLKNKDQAKSFMVGFRTPPYDDTGLFHIFEHAVLQGSRHYPSKSNFFHLVNSSVASFINAMTGPVYTLYPFVTRSDSDFDNLLPTYMDAVFFPNVIKDPRIIKREGWRYEIHPETKKLGINGIVLSEMKGAFSSPYRSLYFQMSRGLLPDTPFAFSSGGLPEKIATLTFEQIKDAHEKYYHPQNSVIYLYGDMDFKKALETIDRDYLNHFTKTADFQRPKIQVQENFKYPTPVIEAIYPGDLGKNKDFIAKGYVAGSTLAQTDENALAILLQAFADNNAAPLKLRMDKERLAKSTSTMAMGGEDNAIGFVFEGANAADQEKISKILNEEIDKVVHEGLDAELLNSILNKYEFAYKEKNANGSHRGLSLGSVVLDNWIYQKEPLTDSLDFVKQFKELRVKFNDKEFVKAFFKKHLQENERVRWLVLKPDPHFSETFNAGLDKMAAEALKTYSIEDLSKEDAAYQEWVSMKEAADIINKTPILKLADVQVDETPIPFTKSSNGTYENILYPQDTSGISYVNLYFDLSGVSKDNLKNLNLFTDFIERTDTKNYPFQDLSKKIDTTIGGLGFSISNYQSAKDPQKFRPTLEVSIQFINENQKEAFALVKELMTNSQFGPNDRLNSLVQELKTGMTSSISSRAPSLSFAAATKSFFPAMGAFSDEVDGGLFENYVLKTDISADTLAPQLRSLLTDIFNQKRVYLTTVVSPQSALQSINAEVGNLVSALPAEGPAEQSWTFNNQVHYDGYAIPGEVQYVTQVASYADKGLPYEGSMLVYSRFLNNNYMTPRLREQAGAYGGRSEFTRTGLFIMSTYRDPNLKKSFDIFSEAINFMKKEDFTQEKLTPAILGSLKPYYGDRSIYGKTQFMTDLYLSDQTWDDYMKIKKQIIQTSPQDMQKISEVLLPALNTSKKAVAGNAKKIKIEANFLKNVLTIQ